MAAKSPRSTFAMSQPGQASFYPAVTIAISKRKGTNAVIVADNVLQRIEPLKGSVIPSDVQVDYHARITAKRRPRNRTSCCCTC